MHRFNYVDTYLSPVFSNRLIHFTENSLGIEPDQDIILSNMTFQLLMLYSPLIHFTDN